MIVQNKARLAAVGLALCVVAVVAAEPLPQRLSDAEFWKLVTDLSEPGAGFHSENLVSNELRFQSIVPELSRKATPNRAYVGVGSEQNFTYIAATRPAIAFIVDIRRGNLDLHLLYKALFELSANRVEFVSRMFARRAPAVLAPTATPAELFGAFRNVPADPALRDRNLAEVKAHLMTKHGFKLSADDLAGMDYVYGEWFRYGPNIRYELTTGGRRGGRGGGGPGGFPTYADLMTATDGAGRNRSFLADDATFRALKDLQTRNLIVPVVGNFGGPKALRAVGAYLKQKETVISTFYASNVEQYLQQDGIWGNFCASVATMPLDASTLLVRSERGGFAGQRAAPAAGFALEIAALRQEVAQCPAGR